MLLLLRYRLTLLQFNILDHRRELSAGFHYTLDGFPQQKLGFRQLKLEIAGCGRCPLGMGEY